MKKLWYLLFPKKEQPEKQQIKVQSTIEPTEKMSCHNWMLEYRIGILRRYRCENDISSIIIPKR